ncbi:MAG: penicillin-insensitive murein endopeptidase, partial [Myxococcota bacterium]|nr:penicillin-insensitive murein endopeptidase [Myxococcota bacterium]
LAKTWLSIKRERDIRAQHKRMQKARLDITVGDGLIDLRALEGAGLPPFRSRDRVRGRTWVSRTMAAVLIEAWRRFHAKHPRALLTLGDLAQPGGGGIMHNVIVRNVDGAQAVDLLDQAHVHAGELTADVMRTAADFPGERGRFESPDDRVWLRHRILALLDTDTAEPVLRTATTRYTFPTTLAGDARSRAFSEMTTIAQRGTLVSAEQRHQTALGGGSTLVWRHHWVDARTRRQLVTISDRKQHRQLDMRWVREARVAQWQKRKPGSFPKERCWVRDTADPAQWTRWQAMREAGHVTHMGGSDADISFVTRDNRRHFAVDRAAFDARRTWDWFKAVDAAARAMGTRIDVILISSPILRALQRKLGKSVRKARLWRKHIRQVGGHDAHHHLRLARPTADSEARARAVLTALSPHSASVAPPAESATP